MCIAHLRFSYVALIEGLCSPYKEERMIGRQGMHKYAKEIEGH